MITSLPEWVTPMTSYAGLNLGVLVRRSLANIRTDRRRRAVRKPQVPHRAVVGGLFGAVVQLDGILVLHRAALDAQADLAVGDWRDPEERPMSDWLVLFRACTRESCDIPVRASAVAEGDDAPADSVLFRRG